MIIINKTHSMKILYKSTWNIIEKIEKIFIELKLRKFWSRVFNDFLFYFFCWKIHSVLFVVFFYVNSFVINLGLKVLESKALFSVKRKNFFIARIEVIIHSILKLLILNEILNLFFFEFLILKFFFNNFMNCLRDLLAF